LREGPNLRNDARLDVPSTVISTGSASDQVKDFVARIIGDVAAQAHPTD
jgi:hypothetical protein